jgi:hypothetical protein
MPADSRISRAPELYLALAASERATVEGLLCDDFAFSRDQIGGAEVCFGWNPE